MIEIKETGGARIGMANATWPFATLTVNKEMLQLNAAIIGNLVFKPGDIVSIEPYTTILSFGKGIKINHRVGNYNQKVIFWTMSNPAALIDKIKQTGFLNNTNQINATLNKEITAAQAQGGFPIKIPLVIAIVVLWNIFFLVDFKNNATPGIGSQLALGFILITCILLLTFEPVRRLILKEGRTIDSIRGFIFFLMIIIGFILLMITISH